MHVSALLHALADSRPKEEEVAPTSLPCKWLQPHKRQAPYALFSQGSFRKYHVNKREKRDRRSLLLHRPVSAIHSGNAAKNLQKLLSHLDGTSSCMALLFDNVHTTTGSSSASPSARGQPTSTMMTDLEMADDAFLTETLEVVADVQAEDQRSGTVTEDDILEEMKVIEEQIRKIKEDTRGQSTNVNWFTHRQQRLTASQFGRVCKIRETTSPKNIVEDIHSSKQKWSRTPASIQHGINNEPHAIKLYTKEKGPQCQVDACGLFVHPMHSWLVASPDGLVMDSVPSPPQGLLEIKCLYAEDQKGYDPLRACEEMGRNSQFYCTKDDKGQLSLKANHAYYYQIQGQMAITGRHWCDFVVMSACEIATQRIPFNQTFWNDCFIKLRHFYFTFVLPQILRRRVGNA